MPRLRRLFELANGKLPSYNEAFTKLRGLAFPLDIFLKGTVRFARKLGAVLPVWIPDNATTLSANVPAATNRLPVNDTISWVEIGSKLRLAEELLVFVDDVVDSGATYILTEDLPAAFENGDTVELFAHPLEIVGTYIFTVTPITLFVVYSKYPIYRGDDINYRAFDYAVQDATFIGTIPDGRFEYQLTIAEGVPVTLDNGNRTTVYLRANPSYESPILPIPNVLDSQDSIGPFLYDRISGSFFTDLDVTEIDTVTTYDAANSPISTFYDCGKNFLIYNRQIPADSFLFWDILRGKLNWNGATQQFRATTDDDGKFHLHFKCVPTIVQGQVPQWAIRVIPDVTCRMIVELEPNASTAYTLLGGVEQTVVVNFPPGADPMTHWHILFDSDVTPDVKIHFKAWDIQGTRTTAQLKHVTIAKVAGRFLWGSTPAFAKPYFLRLTYLKAQADLYAVFNSGLIAT